jgi:Predicted esterase
MPNLTTSLLQHFPHDQIYDSRLHYLRFYSLALQTVKGCYLYLPPEAKQYPQMRFPSVYFLRGHEREWINSAEDASRGKRNLIDVYLDLRARALVGPMILVFPGISSDDNHWPGLLCNWRAPALAQGASGVGTGRFESYFIDDLIPLIDRRFPTIAKGQHRALAGFSLGGFMAFKIAMQYPALFASVSAYDGTFLYSHEDGESLDRDDSVIKNPIFAPAWGEPRDFAFIQANNPSTLLSRADLQHLKQIKWMIQYGPESGEPWSSNYYRGAAMLKLMERHGLENQLDSAVLADGEHSWRTADRHIAEALPIHYCAIRCSKNSFFGNNLVIPKI